MLYALFIYLLLHVFFLYIYVVSYLCLSHCFYICIIFIFFALDCMFYLPFMSIYHCLLFIWYVLFLILVSCVFLAFLLLSCTWMLLLAYFTCFYGMYFSSLFPPGSFCMCLRIYFFLSFLRFCLIKLLVRRSKFHKSHKSGGEKIPTAVSCWQRLAGIVMRRRSSPVASSMQTPPSGVTARLNLLPAFLLLLVPS